jgi:hypothetical protein
MKTKLTAFTLVAAMALATAAPGPALALNQEERNKLAGAVLGLVIAKKVAEQRQKQKARGEPYEPRTGILCLPEVRKCYMNNRYSSSWTHREFD